MSKKGKKVFTVKFDLVQNIEEQLKIASKEDIKKYQENEDAFNKEFIERFKADFKRGIDNDDYYWIENVEVKEKIED